MAETKGTDAVEETESAIAANKPDSDASDHSDGCFRLSAVQLDPQSIQPANAETEHERSVAIYDLVEENSFQPVGHDEGGPYRLDLSMIERKLVLDIKRENGEQIATHILSLTPFRRIIKDYFLICDSYYEAIKTATPSRIEAIDMGRRGLHNEGSQILQSRLEGKIITDFPTARRLFTLICALHWRG
ncbi:UPF0262 family protein [Cohaesibacter sp. CAU 1516]|uniref:UPF0262 family protein n=1 Tax=Cohaesibacter sp. CAU 1516 TaxID=2576038 RepID=UPI0010FD7582|nr:UPF0262 family protein [Cohaesibacter sp. CAU 1516]TLP43951.1 UPF0262 family protein [Cohaesibacter sp. CAU 1516]